MSTPEIRRRKKPVEVVTMQWLGDNLGDVAAFTDGSFFPADPGDFIDPDITGKVYDYLHSTWVGVKTGQHLVRGIKREYYPIDDGDVLDQSYDLIPAVDTLAHWLYLRFGKTATAWETLDLADREYWAHEAQAVRRAVARGGFRTANPKAGDR